MPRARISPHLALLSSAAQQLTCSGQLGYLGTSWRKDVAFAGYGVPLQVSAVTVQLVTIPSSRHASNHLARFPACNVA